jgi:hypothetical protein
MKGHEEHEVLTVKGANAAHVACRSAISHKFQKTGVCQEDIT